MRDLAGRLAAVAILGLALTTAVAQPALVITPLAEKKVDALPPGPLVWRIETLPSLSAARSAAGSFSLAVEGGGKSWLFTLAPAGGSTPGAVFVTEVGPIPLVNASTYLLRINDASGLPGSLTPVHRHPGSEAFYVLEGEQSIRGEHGTLRVRAGEAEPGHGADTAMQVSSSGQGNLHALVMFVVDANRPFSSPATLP